MDYVNQLQNIGLKKEEAQVYLACLKLGFAKVSDLAEAVEIPRTSIYVYLKALIHKGYIKKSKKQSVEYFTAVEPSLVLEDVKEKMSSFAGIVAQLERLSDFAGKKPKIEFFDTKQGMINMYEAMLKMQYKHTFYTIESGEAMKNNLEKLGLDFWYGWRKKFSQKDISMQGIITKDAIPVLQSMPEKVRRTALLQPSTARVIDEKEFPFSVSLCLFYPDRIFIIVPQQNFVLTIENKDIYDSMLTLFKALYEKARSINVREIVGLER